MDGAQGGSSDSPPGSGAKPTAFVENREHNDVVGFTSLDPPYSLNK